MNKVIAKLLWRVIELEKFKKEYKPEIERLVSQELIEEAVKKAIKKRDHLYLSGTQKVAALILFSIAILDFLRTFNLL